MEKQQNLSIYKELEEKLATTPEPENQLYHILEFMESALSRDKTPHLKEFWDARTKCLEIMKMEISPLVRTISWEKFTDLTQQARRLKEIFEKESAFAQEQFEKAIQALDEELAKVSVGEMKLAHEIHLKRPFYLKDHFHKYEVLQREISLLNAFAERIHSFRRELSATQMRVKKKNDLFQKLSESGDKVFPERKQLIEKLSDLFVQDMDRFLKDLPKPGEAKESLNTLRNEIKELQAFAKVITLNQEGFKKSRKSLTEAWERLKGLEEIRRSEQDKKIEESKAQAKEIFVEIEQLTSQYKEGKISLTDADKKERDLNFKSHQRTIGKPEQKELVQALKEVHELIHQAKVELEERVRKEAEVLKEKRNALYQELKDKIAAGVKTESDLAELQKQLADSNLLQPDKKRLRAMLDPLRDSLLDQEQKQLKGDQVDTFLAARKQRRQEIKEEMDRLRKASGVSGISFEQQMENQESLRKLKERLAAMENKIGELEGR
jgi:hypothetical protein